MHNMTTPRHFFVKAVWDDEAKVFYSESDIIGLHIETDTLAEFEAMIDATASELIFANHFTAQQLTQSTLADLMPIVKWSPPTLPLAAHA
jgi:Domain of unknown function (DUF1902)